MLPAACRSTRRVLKMPGADIGHGIEQGSMLRKKRSRIEEKKLTRRQLRKLNAVRKILGDEIGEKAFAEWYEQQAVETTDGDAKTISETLWKLVRAHRLNITRRGYVVKRGRKRLIVEPLSTVLPSTSSSSAAHRRTSRSGRAGFRTDSRRRRQAAHGHRRPEADATM